MKAFFLGFLGLNFSTDNFFIKLILRISIYYLNMGVVLSCTPFLVF